MSEHQQKFEKDIPNGYAGLDSNGNILFSQIPPSPYKIISANYTIIDSDETIEVDTAGVIVALPTAIGRLGVKFMIDNSSTGDITVVPDGAETIQEEITQTVPPNSNMVVMSNNINYRIK